MNSTKRDARVFALYEQLLEIEQRLIPTGLHIFGRASSSGEQIDLLKMVALFDRPEHGIRALPQDVVGDAVRTLLDKGSEAAIRFCEAHGLDEELTRPVFELLENLSAKLQTNTEIDSLVRALAGRSIPVRSDAQG